MKQELPQSEANKATLHVICSEADHGTRSISGSYVRNLQPENILRFSKGFKRMGWKGWLAGAKFIRRHSAGTVLCLFNAPILLAAVFRKKSSNVRFIGVLDWTESYPSNKKNSLTKFYDKLYLWAFSRLDAVFSPSQGFQEYYNERGARIKSCFYPLPREVDKDNKPPNPSTVKVLFVGADIVRKGGDILLEEWKNAQPVGATLTFVSPDPPIDEIPGVTYLNQIKAGTKEHRDLFSTHDILVLPSHHEPFGYVLLEAINHGMCTITTNAVGASEIVREAGGIVKPDPKSACKEVIRLVQAREEIQIRSANSINYACLYESMYRKILE